jgi:hypothetical protein
MPGSASPEVCDPQGERRSVPRRLQYGSTAGSSANPGGCSVGLLGGSQVQQAELAVGQQQQIARVRVGVEGAFQHDLAEHAVQQAAGQRGPYIRGRAGVDRGQRPPVEAFHHQYPLGAQRLARHRDPDSGRGTDAGRGGHRRHVAFFHPQVELLAQGSGETLGESGRADRPAQLVLRSSRAASRPAMSRSRSTIIVFADDDGVLFVAAQRAEQVLVTADQIWQSERDQARRIREGQTLRQQTTFDDYLARRATDPSYTSGSICAASAGPSKNRIISSAPGLSRPLPTRDALTQRSPILSGLALAMRTHRPLRTTPIREARRKSDQGFREGAIRLVRETGKRVAITGFRP